MGSALRCMMQFKASNDNKTNTSLLTFTKNTYCVDFTLSKDKLIWEFL